jgi:hypothetical protein
LHAIDLRACVLGTGTETKAGGGAGGGSPSASWRTVCQYSPESGENGVRLGWLARSQEVVVWSAIGRDVRAYHWQTGVHRLIVGEAQGVGDDNWSSLVIDRARDTLFTHDWSSENVAIVVSGLLSAEPTSR